MDEIVVFLEHALCGPCGLDAICGLCWTCAHVRCSEQPALSEPAAQRLVWVLACGCTVYSTGAAALRPVCCGRTLVWVPLPHLGLCAAAALRSGCCCRTWVCVLLPHLGLCAVAALVLLLHLGPCAVAALRPVCCCRTCAVAALRPVCCSHTCVHLGLCAVAALVLLPLSGLCAVAALRPVCLLPLLLYFDC